MAHLTARPYSKSYLCANYNSKYAMILVTILRPIHNFCKIHDSSPEPSPAQKPGIADKAFDLEDIL